MKNRVILGIGTAIVFCSILFAVTHKASEAPEFPCNPAIFDPQIYYAEDAKFQYLSMECGEHALVGDEKQLLWSPSDRYFKHMPKLSLTTTGSGTATYNGSTNVMNVPTPAIPSQVNITSGIGISVTGTYPNITVSKNKRQETYSGTTNVSGNYTVTFGTAYSVAPNIQANIVGGTALQRSIITNISTTGFTVQALSQNTNTLLGIINLVSGTTVINGSSIDVLITEK